jgi:hypothetical protein
MMQVYDVTLDYRAARSGDEQARQRIINGYIPYAIAIARNVHRSRGGNFLELRAQALLLLVQGVDCVCHGAVDHHVGEPDVKAYLSAKIGFALIRFRQKDRLFAVSAKRYHTGKFRTVTTVEHLEQVHESTDLENVEMEDMLKAVNVTPQEHLALMSRLAGHTDEQIGQLLGGLPGQSAVSKARVGQIMKGLGERVRARYKRYGLGECLRQSKRLPTKEGRLSDDIGRQLNSDGSCFAAGSGTSDLHPLPSTQGDGIEVGLVLSQHGQSA